MKTPDTRFRKLQNFEQLTHPIRPTWQWATKKKGRQDPKNRGVKLAIDPSFGSGGRARDAIRPTRGVRLGNQGAIGFELF